MHFQTPPAICEYMANFLPDNVLGILEPTPGEGNLSSALAKKGNVFVPSTKFEDLDPRLRSPWIVMNPPFTPMKRGYEILWTCMDWSDNIIALMPWLTIINSQKRADALRAFGLVSVTHLPRNAFPGSRVQTCILELRKGYTDETKLLFYGHHTRKH